MVASMLRAQRRDPAKAQAKCAFATNYPLANRQLRSPLILRYRTQRDKPFDEIGTDPERRCYGGTVRRRPYSSRWETHELAAAGTLFA